MAITNELKRPEGARHRSPGEEKLRETASGTSRRIRARKPSLLVGLIFDGELPIAWDAQRQMFGFS